MEKKGRHDNGVWDNVPSMRMYLVTGESKKKHSRLVAIITFQDVYCREYQKNVLSNSKHGVK